MRIHRLRSTFSQQRINALATTRGSERSLLRWPLKARRKSWPPLNKVQIPEFSLQMTKKEKKEKKKGMKRQKEVGIIEWIIMRLKSAPEDPVPQEGPEDTLFTRKALVKGAPESLHPEVSSSAS